MTNSADPDQLAYSEVNWLPSSEVNCFGSTLFVKAMHIRFQQDKAVSALIFSLPEHEVIKASYCDHAVSVIRASCVVRRPSSTFISFTL